MNNGCKCGLRHKHLQEWNVSREESKDLVKRGAVISDGEEDAEVIAIEFNKNPVSWTLYSRSFFL
jgi:hypothetical protein